MSNRLSKTVAAALPLSVLLALPLLSSSGPSTAPHEGSPTSGATDPHALASQYIGAGKCKNCHNSSETGDQYGVWMKAKHSIAYETLASSTAAKEAAAPLGIEDPSQSDSCLKCHVTGFGEPEKSFARGFKQEAGVQCETCHGPGGDHMKARFKVAASGVKTEGYQGSAVDEVVVSPGVDVCVKCHNPESPSYKPFCYYEARGKIAHLNPQKPRSAEEVANFGICPHGNPCPHGEGCPDGTCNVKPDALAAMKAAAMEKK